MNVTKLVSVISVLCITTGLLACCCPAFCDDGPTTIAQDNEQKARIHYLNGESASKSGDVLTAVVEWEAALTLKPSSALSAKYLVAAAAKLGDDGQEAYAHYVNAAELQRQGKLDEAAEEVALAVTYKPNGSVPSCLTAKAAEIADLKKAAAKPAQEPEPKQTATTAAAADKSTTTATKPADDATAKAAAAQSAPTPKASKQSKSTQKPAKQPVRRTPQRAPRPPMRTIRAPHPKLVYQHGYTANGKRIPGHYTIKTVR